MTLTLIAIGAFVATFLGGVLALRVRDKLHLILGFSAGAVIGVAFFDLLPEAIELGAGAFTISTITAVVATGFVLYMIIDRFVFPHYHEHGEGHGHGADAHAGRGLFGAGSLSVHSLLDGIGIGLAFQVSTAVGLIVALAVLAHDFSDGVNTVSMIIRDGGSRKLALKWLFVDAIAPTIGIILASFFVLSDATLGLLLAVFCGFFLYIGASDLLPESYHAHPRFWTTIVTLFGVLFLYVVIRLAGI